MDKPKITYCMKKASAEKEVHAMINSIFERSGLPHFMRVDILRAVLAEEQQKAYIELAADTEAVMRNLTEYHEEQLKELSDASDREKAELIEAFENPGAETPGNAADNEGS